MRLRWGAVLPVSATVVIFACGGGTDTGDGGPMLDCLGGSRQCGDACVIISTDRENCGDCGNKCADGEVCAMGKCSVVCGGTTMKCGDVCADYKVDPKNCGACGLACSMGQVCSAGKCSLTCGGGSTMCGTIDGGTAMCVDTNSDRNNCGGCGMPCDLGLDCIMGMCQLQCQQGLTSCPTPDSGIYPPDAGDAAMLGPDVCTNTNIDPFNCGMCGTVCNGSKPKCSNGNCVQADAGM